MTRRRVASIALVSLVPWLLLSCEAEQNDLDLVLDSYDGFACVVGDELVACDVAGAGCLVLDVITLDGLPSCRQDSLVAACSGGGCRVAARVLIDMRDVTCPCPGDPDGQVADQGERLLAQLDDKFASGAHTLRDAPDGTALVRLVATTQSCDELGGASAPDLSASFSPESIRGCAYSCPAELDDVHETVHLGLTGVGSGCNARAECMCAIGILEPDQCVDELFTEDGRLAGRPERCSG